MLITGVLVLVVFASAADSVNSPNVKGSAPLAIGYINASFIPFKLGIVKV